MTPSPIPLYLAHLRHARAARKRAVADELIRAAFFPRGKQDR